MQEKNIKVEEKLQVLLDNIKRVLVIGFILLFPVLIFPFFREIFYIGKTIFTISIALALLSLSLLQILITRKIEFKKNGFEGSLLFFLIAYFLSWIITTPNKMQSLFVSTEGLLFLFSLIIIVRTASVLRVRVLPLLTFSSILVAFSLILSFTNVFKNVSLPQWISFLKSPYFTPVGSYLEALVFIFFILVYALFVLFSKDEKDKPEMVLERVLFGIAASLGILAIVLGVYNILNPVEIDGQPFRLILPPFRESWYAAVEILKGPITAIFGVGINNFSSIFTRVKTINYNQSDLWNIASFNLSASAFLHIFTTTGILGFASFLYLIARIYKNIYKEGKMYHIVPFALLILSFVLLPITPISLLLLLAFIPEFPIKKEKYLIDLGRIFLVYISVVGVLLAFIAVLFYNLARYTLAEIYFAGALQAVRDNKAAEVFDLHRQAALSFPYLEDLRRSFAEVNVILLNNYIQQLAEETNKENPDKEKVEQLRNSINQIVQAAINEAKALVALNPYKASSWAFLADIYRNILFLAENAGGWAISSYQRAIALDPLNPNYNLNLGGVYFSLKDYKRAEKTFENLISMKPDWPNAYYNYAWVLYQQENYEGAVRAMEMVMNLIEGNEEFDEQSRERVKKDLEEFRKRLPKQEEKEASPEAEPSPQLQIPTPPQPALEDKIELPLEASPEAE